MQPWKHPKKTEAVPGPFSTGLFWSFYETAVRKTWSQMLCSPRSAIHLSVNALEVWCKSTHTIAADAQKKNLMQCMLGFLLLLKDDYDLKHLMFSKPSSPSISDERLKHHISVEPLQYVLSHLVFTEAHVAQSEHNAKKRQTLLCRCG